MISLINNQPVKKSDGSTVTISVPCNSCHGFRAITHTDPITSTMETCLLIPESLSLVLRPAPSVARGGLLEMGATIWASQVLPPGTLLRPDAGKVKLDTLEIYGHLKPEDVSRKMSICHAWKFSGFYLISGILPLFCHCYCWISLIFWSMIWFQVIFLTGTLMPDKFLKLS